jgi:hypothetical protein
VSVYPQKLVHVCLSTHFAKTLSHRCTASGVAYNQNGKTASVSLRPSSVAGSITKRTAFSTLPCTSNQVSSHRRLLKWIDDTF